MLGFAIIGLLATCKHTLWEAAFNIENTDSKADIALATTNPEVSPILHVLFILALLLTSIVLTHTLVRLCCLSTRSDKRRVVRIEPAPRRRRHRHHREPPVATTACNHYIPPTPIAVHGPEPEPELQHSGAVPAQEMFEVGGKGIEMINPPPVYGSTTNSVPADPELLFWHAIPSPMDKGVPSPTYEEVARESVNESEGGRQQRLRNPER